mgnify:CR=1 FL=1
MPDAIAILFDIKFVRWKVKNYILSSYNKTGFNQPGRLLHDRDGFFIACRDGSANGFQWDLREGDHNRLGFAFEDDVDGDKVIFSGSLDSNFYAINADGTEVSGFPLDVGEKMIKGVGLNYLPKTIVIPHYGESFYSWISNTVKMLNRGRYKLLCLEKDTYFLKDGKHLSVLGKQNVHIIYKKEHHTFSDGDTIDASLLQ